jgi:acetoacetate decarboxylase
VGAIQHITRGVASCDSRRRGQQQAYHLAHRHGQIDVVADPPLPQRRSEVFKEGFSEGTRKSTYQQIAHKLKQEKGKKMGRMTKDRYGFSGPVGTSLFCEPPYHIRESENLLMFYEADAEAVTDILPEGVELLSTPPIVQVLVNKTTLSNAGPHYETYIFPQCQFEGKPYTFEYFLMVTTDLAMASGREFWGDSKKLCHTYFVWEANEVFTTVERPKGLRLATTHFRIERMAAPEELPDMHPGLCLKMIPSKVGRNEPCQRKPEVRHF